MDHVADIVRELLPQRFAKAHLVAQRRQALLARGRAEHHHGRVSRDQFHHEEAYQDDPEQLRDHVRDAAGNVAQQHGQRSEPESTRRRAGSASTSRLAPTSAKPNTVMQSAMPGNTDGHHWPVTTF